MLNVNKIFLAVIVVFLSGVLFGSGYLFASRAASKSIGEHAMGSFLQELAVLQYIENGDIEKAKKILVLSMRSLRSAIENNGVRDLDVEYPGAKEKYFSRFERLEKSVNSHPNPR